MGRSVGGVGVGQGWVGEWAVGGVDGLVVG